MAEPLQEQHPLHAVLGRLGLCWLVAAAAFLVAAGPTRTVAVAQAPAVEVVVDPARATAPPIAKRFTGLSFEVGALPVVARGAGRGNLVELLRSVGPGVLRFGGFTADTRSAFVARGPAPSWAPTAIRPGDFDRLARLARRTGWRVLLTLGLGRYDPARAARAARAAARRLGPWLAGFQIGNEPNAFWLIALRPVTYAYTDYLREFRAYRRAIAKVAPGVPFAGPDVVPQVGGFEWLDAFARDVRPAVLTPHYYALNACSPGVITTSDLLGEGVASVEAQTLASFAAVARTHGIPLRVGETNNVACAGRSGVSDTFASALWALRHMFAIARRGLAGVNFHTLPKRCAGYSPICMPDADALRALQLRANPEWYALLLFRQLAGDRPVASSPARLPDGLSIHAFRRPDAGGIDVVAVNAAEARQLELRVAAPDEPRAGEVLRLTAPALDATTGVRLGGRPVRRDGTWRPARPSPVPVRRGVAAVSLPAGSAALIRLQG